MMRFLRYQTRHHLWWPRGYKDSWRPQLNPTAYSSHGKNGKRTFNMREPGWLFHLRQRLFCVAGRHRCDRRNEAFAFPVVSDKALPDTWRLGPDGCKTCSYCGSMSEEDFIDIMEHYVAGDPGYRFEATSKRYKYYANRPGVVNAGNGAIKFYTAHINPNHADIEKRDAIFKKAMAKHREEMRRLFERPYPAA